MFPKSVNQEDETVNSLPAKLIHAYLSVWFYILCSLFSHHDQVVLRWIVAFFQSILHQPFLMSAWLFWNLEVENSAELDQNSRNGPKLRNRLSLESYLTIYLHLLLWSSIFLSLIWVKVALIWTLGYQSNPEKKRS